MAIDNNHEFHNGADEMGDIPEETQSTFHMITEIMRRAGSASLRGMESLNDRIRHRNEEGEQS